MIFEDETPGQITEIGGRPLQSPIPVGVGPHPAGYIATYEISTLQGTPTYLSSIGDSPEDAFHDLGEHLLEYARELDTSPEQSELTDEEIERLHLERILQTKT